MSRIVLESPLRSLSPHEPATEQEFEDQLLRCASKLFPSYSAGSWKPLVRDAYGRGARPDMVLASAELELWYVVEIELAHHPVVTHIRPQLETLSQGIYDRTMLLSLSTVLPDFPGDVLRDFAYKEPGLLCISNGYSDALRSACRDNSFELAVLEPYHGDAGDWALSVTHVAPLMRPAVRVGEYQLRRGHIAGDKEFMQLPQHFPLLKGTVSVLHTDGDVHECRVHIANSRRYLIVPADIAPRGRSVRLVMVDRGQGTLRLEVE